jgi:hypothetical protein
MNKTIVFIALALVFSSCATITRATSQAFSVISDPTGSTVTFSNGLSCTTPCSIEAKRKPGFSVSATKEGEVRLSKRRPASGLNYQQNF